MTLSLVLLIWSLASCGLAPLVGQMIARNNGRGVLPSYVLLPAQRRSRQKGPRSFDQRR